MKRKLVIATRGSKLALWQANYIKKLIEDKNPDIKCKLNIIKTTGDKILDVPLAKIGGKGLFVKEIESALINGKADLAVHSMKDLPMDLPSGLEIYASPKSETSHDAFLSVKYNSILELPKEAKIGTSSLRRKLQLLEKRCDLNIIDLRGNVDTRIKKLEEGHYDAIILAKAGLVRLGLTDHVKEDIPFDIMLPASCQGILGIETRVGDTEVNKYLTFLKDKESEDRAKCERAFLKRLEGGCQIPIGCHSELLKEKMTVTGVLYNLSGSIKIKMSVTGSRTSPIKLGSDLAEKIINAGGDKILKEIYS